MKMNEYVCSYDTNDVKVNIYTSGRKYNDIYKL